MIDTLPTAEKHNLEVLFPHCPESNIAIDDGETQVTWSALARRTGQWLHLMQQVWKLKPGDHIALLMSNNGHYPECLLASICAGVWITPVNCHLQTNEVCHIINDSGSKYLICDSDHVNIAKESQAEHVVCLDPRFAHALSRQACQPVDETALPGGTMMYTSGTTGWPKGVKRQQAASVSSALSAMRDFGHRVGVNGKGPHLVTGPLYHAAPGLFALYDLLNGASLVIMKKWDSLDFLETVKKHKIRHTHLVPIHFERLLKLPEKQKLALTPASLRRVLHGAAPVSRNTKKAMIAWWGPILDEYWGATETGVISLCSSPEWLAHPGTVGKPLSFYDVFACNENGQKLAAGESGTLFARHRDRPQLFSYHNDPEKTAAAHPEPCLVTLGDIGHVDQDGFVFLTDRKQNLIISGGVNIYPAEIEQVFMSHPAIHDIAVFGVINQEWGEQVEAAVILQNGYPANSETSASLVTYAERHLAKFKLPRHIHFVDSLPRGPSGKLITRYLRFREPD
ncbi:MAG: AMP-binding protein [Pseudomonadales bacterium]|nr:AMP-binding protein [Pseudomonadales bacterium]